jgi:predicted alpha/beta hydrolase
MSIASVAANSPAAPTATSAAVDHRNVRISAEDGTQLAVDVFRPPSGRLPTAVLVVNGATGVRRGFYKRFASHVAAGGFAALTYDYRGVGDSLASKLAASDARMRDWGEKDFPAVLRWAEQSFAGLPLFVLGHSVGGQLFGLTPQVRVAHGLIGVAAQSGYWQLSSTRARMWFNWNILVPGLSRAFGYLPGWSGVGASLPKQVALEWARWCRSADFFVDVDGRKLRTYFDEVTCPILWVGIENDPYATRRAVSWLADQFTRAPIARRELSGGQYGTGPIGHFKLFTPRYTAAWDEVLQWMRQQLQRPSDA